MDDQDLIELQGRLDDLEGELERARLDVAAILAHLRLDDEDLEKIIESLSE